MAGDAVAVGARGGPADACRHRSCPACADSAWRRGSPSAGRGGWVQRLRARSSSSRSADRQPAQRRAAPRYRDDRAVKTRPRRGPLLHDLPEIHHHHPVGEIAHQRQIVADEDQRGVVIALDICEQPRHRRLDRNVEGGDRLVGDHHGRIAGEGAGNADALLSARRKAGAASGGRNHGAASPDRADRRPVSRTFTRSVSTPNLRITRAICAPTLWLGLSVSLRILKDHLQGGDLPLRARRHGALGNVVAPRR